MRNRGKKDFFFFFFYIKQNSSPAANYEVTDGRHRPNKVVRNPMVQHQPVQNESGGAGIDNQQQTVTFCYRASARFAFIMDVLFSPMQCSISTSRLSAIRRIFSPLCMTRSLVSNLGRIETPRVRLKKVGLLSKRFGNGPALAAARIP